MINILHYTGMGSNKYGGLERFFVQLAKKSKALNQHHIFIYRSMPTANEYLCEMKNAGGEIFVVNDNNKIHFLCDLAKIFKRKQIHIIQTYFGFELVGIALLTALICNVKIRILSQHLLVQSHRTRLGKIFAHMLFEYLPTKIICVSKAVENNLHSLYSRTKYKTDVLYLGAENSNIRLKNPRLQIRRELNVMDDEILIGNIAFHNPIKGIDVLIQAFLILLNKYPNCKLLQIGDYEFHGKQNLELAKSLGIDNKIIWLGRTNDVAYYLRAMDIYVQPSRSEAIGISLMEAAMAELPLIGSNVGGIPEVVKENYNGFLFPIEDVDELAKCMGILVNDKNKRDQFGKNSLQLAQKNFTLVDCAENYVNYYSQLYQQQYK